MQGRNDNAGLLVMLALAAVLLAACHGGATSTPEATALVTQAQRDAALDGADWTKKVDLTITIRDYGYLPRELRLRSGQPYRITLVNHGSVPHYFTAPEFLATVAARKAEVPHQAEVKAPVFAGFEIQPRGGSLNVYLVPLRTGSYRAYCHLKDHLAMGVEGVLVVE
ncbi:MAG: hypothetical protein OEZ09_09925 [Betaproteobacteria bacterium]|nr:hypothetical protein [Betaproteobacteria bacterium]MDH4326688.1 hypothetical protein [Betaproteobacteria bacterium]MDH5578764.1 hypothetical protein [Betaproteobacteria bacterium]